MEGAEPTLFTMYQCLYIFISNHHFFIHTIHCSAVFSLPEGKMLSYFGIVPHGHVLDIPNGVLGMIFYTYTIIRYFVTRKMNQKLKRLNSVVNHKDNDKKLKPNILFASSVNMIISTLAIASSLFLGRKLWILKELCVVCVSTHIINTTLWMRAIDELATPNTSSSMDNPNVKGVTLHKVPPKKKQ